MGPALMGPSLGPPKDNCNENDTSTPGSKSSCRLLETEAHSL